MSQWTTGGGFRLLPSLGFGLLFAPRAVQGHTGASTAGGSSSLPELSRVEVPIAEGSAMSGARGFCQIPGASVAAAAALESRLVSGGAILVLVLAGGLFPGIWCQGQLGTQMFHV